MSFRLDKRSFVLLLIFVGYLFCYLDRMIMSAVIPYIGKDLELTKTEMGMVMSAFFVGYTVFQIPGGILVDKFGSRRVMAVAITIWSVFTGVTGMVGNLFQMLFSRVIFGVGEGPYPAASMKSIAAWFPPSKRGFATSVILSSNSVGPAIAPLLAVFLMSLWGWRGAFYALVIPGLILAVLIWRYVEDKPKADENGEEVSNKAQAAQPEVVASFWEVLRNPAVWKSTVMFFFYNMGAWGFKSWLPTYLVSARGMDMKTMGVVASLPFIAGIGGYLFGGWLSDGYFKNNRRIPVVVFQLLTALLLYLMVTVDSIPMLVVFQTMTGFFLTAALAATWALPVSSVPKAITGRAVGIFNTGGQLAGLISPTVIGFLVDKTGGSFNSSFIFMIICIVISSVLALGIRIRTSETD